MQWSDMNHKRIIPVLLLKNNKLVKGVKFKDHKYIGDPVNSVKLFNDLEVDELSILDIGATNNNQKPNFELIENIVSEAFMPISYGGGVSSVDDCKKLFKIGVEKVIFGTVAFTNPKIVQSAVDLFGGQSIVISLDIKRSFFGRFHVYINSGKTKLKISLLEAISHIKELSSGEVIINVIHKDGTRSGLDEALIDFVNSNFDVPCIALGGLSSIQNISDIFNSTSISAVAAGSYFVYKGKHKAVLINYLNKDEINFVHGK